MKFSSIRFLLLFVSFLLLTTSGCGEKYPDGMPKLYKVSLTITQEGKPLSGANVTLASEDPAFKWTVGGVTDNNGVVVLKTHGKYTGAPVGKYKLCVKKYVMEGELQSMKNPGAPPPKDYNLVEAEYAQPKTTPLEIEIQAGRNSFEPYDVGQAVKELLKAPGM